MTTSYDGARQRPRLARFTPLPPSVMLAIRSLRNSTAQALLNFLAEKCFGFGRGHADCSYAQLSKVLGRCTRAIARASKLLRELGYVTVDLMRDGSYRWQVPILAGEVKEDPRGALCLRTDAQEDAHPMTVLTWGSCQNSHGGYDGNVMGDMTDRSWGVEAVDNAVDRCNDWAEAAGESEENAGPKRHLQETYTKRLQQETALLAVTSSPEDTNAGDDEPVDHKGLLKELHRVGVSDRVSRKLLREHEHELVAKVLRKAGELDGIQNLAGYIVREVQDGGYEDVSSFLPVETATETKMTVMVSDAPIISPGVEATRLERELFEVEKQRRAAERHSSLKKLLERFGQLDQSVRNALKTYAATRHVENVVPKVAKKDELMRDERYQKIAFRETVERFFELFDLGNDEDGALAVVCEG